MKTKITLLLAAVALTTLSFTFASIDKPLDKDTKKTSTLNHSEPVGGLFAEDAVN